MRLRMPFGRRKELPSHLWTQCPDCNEMLFNKQLARNMNVCPKCEHHFRIAARERIEQLVDKGSFEEMDADVTSGDPLAFVDSRPYPQRLEAARAKSGSREAVICGTARIGREPVELAVMDFEFIGGSMGSAVGEKITRAAERALTARLPLVVVCASGGARMQEGALALMQMAKIVGALSRLGDAGVPYVSVLSDPTTGGVLASFGSLGDLVLAEPKALIGFSGARVTDQTIGERLPAGFQRAEFVLAHGFVDQIVPRAQLRDRLAFFLAALRPRPTDPRWSL